MKRKRFYTRTSIVVAAAILFIYYFFLYNPSHKEVTTPSDFSELERIVWNPSIEPEAKEVQQDVPQPKSESARANEETIAQSSLKKNKAPTPESKQSKPSEKKTDSAPPLRNAGQDKDAKPGTDRVIVKVKTQKGQEELVSVPKEEYELLENGKDLPSTSPLATAEEVEYVEPDYIRSVTATSVASIQPSWGVQRIGANQMISSIGPQSGTIRVAVIDTGVDYNHPWIKDRMLPGYDFVAEDADPMDEHFHGTHVSGIITSVTTPNVKIMPIRALNSSGEGYDSDVAQGIRYAVDKGANVINMSLGGPNPSRTLSDAIQYALARNVVIVVAAGNDKRDTQFYYPASEPRAIVVSATDQNDTFAASFSNFGSTVDVAAPGVEILSAYPKQQSALASGTSMATPFVSGAVAMIKLENPKRTVGEVETLIKKYTVDKGTPGWDQFYGNGILNVSGYNENKPPVIKNTTKTFTIVYNNELKINLSDHVADPENDPLVYTTNRGTISGTILTFVGNQVGKQSILVTVSDGKNTPVSLQFSVTVEAEPTPVTIPVPEVEPTPNPTPTPGVMLPTKPTAPEYTMLPVQRNVELTKRWSIKFDRTFTARDIEKVEIYPLGSNTPVPVTLDLHPERNEIVVIPNQQYAPAKAYRLLIFVRNGKKYEMFFSTK